MNATMTTEAKAHEAAAYLNKNDENGWNYIVGKVGDYFVVDVCDDMGIYLGPI
jgi:hypothetical protein